MKLGYVIIYVEDVSASINFYQSAFGFSPGFVHESGGYAELETGGTVLAFAAKQVADDSLPDGYELLSRMTRPPGIEIAMVTDDVPAAVNTAIAAGAEMISEPAEKPWGQIVGYVRAPDGVLIEVCTPIAS